MATSYSNKYGNGDRRGIMWGFNTLTNIWNTKDPAGVMTLLDGSSGTTIQHGSSVSIGEYMAFCFASKQKIDAITLYGSSNTAMGTWSWEYSDDGITWTVLNASVAITVGTEAAVTIDAAGHYYYRLKLVTSAYSAGTRTLNQIEFKIEEVLPALDRVYVNTSTGLAANSGDKTHPVLTIEQAIARCKPKGKIILADNQTHAFSDTTIFQNAQFTVKGTANSATVLNLAAITNGAMLGAFEKRFEGINLTNFPYVNTDPGTSSSGVYYAELHFFDCRITGRGATSALWTNNTSGAPYILVNCVVRDFSNNVSSGCFSISTNGIMENVVFINTLGFASTPSAANCQKILLTTGIAVTNVNGDYQSLGSTPEYYDYNGKRYGFDTRNLRDDTKFEFKQFGYPPLYPITLDGLDFKPNTAHDSVAGIMNQPFNPLLTKAYWEIKVLTSGTQSFSVGISSDFAPAPKAPTTQYMLHDRTTGMYGWYHNGTGTLYKAPSSGTIAMANVAINDILGLALDMTAHTLALYKNNVLIDTLDYTAQISKFSGSAVALYPSIVFYNTELSINLGETAFAYTPPTGYFAANSEGFTVKYLIANGQTTAATVYTCAGVSLGKAVSALVESDFTTSGGDLAAANTQLPLMSNYPAVSLLGIFLSDPTSIVENKHPGSQFVQVGSDIAIPDIVGITNMTVAYTTAYAGSRVAIGIRIDGGSWMSWNGSAWVTGGTDTLKSTPAATLNALVEANYALLGLETAETIGFALHILDDHAAGNNLSTVDNFSVTFKYAGYLKEVFPEKRVTDDGVTILITEDGSYVFNLIQ